MTARSVVVAFTPVQPIVALVEGHPAGTISVHGQSYVERPLSADPFLGFYDWLRTPGGVLVGVRLTIGHVQRALVALLPHRPYIALAGEHVVSVFWTRSDEGEIDEEASTEQDFGASRAFVSGPGDLVLAFDAGALSDEELAALESMANL